MDVFAYQNIQLPVGDAKPIEIKIDKFLTLQPGYVAPKFSAKTLDGKDISLADLKGKVVLVDFWATWCGPCIKEFPNIKAVYDKYGGPDGKLEVIGICVDSDEGSVRDVIKKRSVTWPQILVASRAKGEIPKAYNVAGVPATFLIGPDGKVLATNLSGKAFEKKIEKAIAKMKSQQG